MNLLPSRALPFSSQVEANRIITTDPVDRKHVQGVIRVRVQQRLLLLLLLLVLMSLLLVMLLLKQEMQALMLLQLLLPMRLAGALPPLMPR